VKEIIIGPSHFRATLLVDDTDFDRINKQNWTLGICKSYNIKTCFNGRIVAIANFVMNDYTNEYDHRDRNIFNNQKDNLRIATKNQNQWNKGIQANNTSGYKGVYWRSDRNKWRAEIKYYNSNIHLGYYKNKKEAAKAYNKKALELFGEFAYLNPIGE